CSGKASTPASARARLDAPPARPYLAYVSTASDATFQHVALAPLDSPAGAAYVSPLACARVHIGGDRGVCLRPTSETNEGKPVTRWWADVFDVRFTRLQRFALTGPPSRVRVAADGRLAASTVFEQGHSYAENGFSTRTTIFDLESQ